MLSLSVPSNKVKLNAGGWRAGDVTSPDYPQGVVQAAVAAFGGLHILVTAAGFTWDGMVHKMGEKQWDAMLAGEPGLSCARL